MINRTHDLPIVRQCQILALSRSTAYDQPTPVSATDLALRRRIDARLRVFVRRPGLGESPGAGVAALQYADHRLLPGGGPGGDHPVGTPDIFNTDQGDPFASLEFTGLLKDQGLQISLDGTGCWRDRVFMERRWRSLTYEELY